MEINLTLHDPDSHKGTAFIDQVRAKAIAKKTKDIDVDHGSARNSNV
jgi:hypothetical protein